MYLNEMAQDFSLKLSPDQMSWVGLIWIIALAGMVIFDLLGKLKPPRKTAQ